MSNKNAWCLGIIFMLLEIGLGVLLWMNGDFSNIPTMWKILISIFLVLLVFKEIYVIGETMSMNKSSDGKYVWKDRKRIVFLGLPLSFTRYRLTSEKLIKSVGFFNTKENEIKLYRVTDLSISRTLGQKLFGLGTVTLHSSDKTDPTLNLLNIKKSYEVKETLSKLVEAERDRKRVSSREIIDSSDPDGCDCGFHDDDDVNEMM